MARSAESNRLLCQNHLLCVFSIATYSRVPVDAFSPGFLRFAPLLGLEGNSWATLALLVRLRSPAGNRTPLPSKRLSGAPEASSFRPSGSPSGERSPLAVGVNHIINNTNDQFAAIRPARRRVCLILASSFSFLARFPALSQTFVRKTRLSSPQPEKRRQIALFRLALLNRTDPPVVERPPHLNAPQIPQLRQPGEKLAIWHPPTIRPAPQVKKQDVAGQGVPAPQRGHPPPDLVKNPLHLLLPSCRRPPARRSCTSCAASTTPCRRKPCGWWHN